MTRVLSELLGRSDPDFMLGLQELERSTGAPRVDIRLSVEVGQQMRRKLKELRLDADDTTGEELYHALGEKLKGDEARLSAALGADGADDQLAQIVRALSQRAAAHTVFALKPTVAKKLLKANLPKRTMKALGYRSADSMLKHEQPASLMMAARYLETEQWTKKLLAAYAKLKSSDFEPRPVAIEYPSSKRWEALSESVLTKSRRHVAVLGEMGTVVVLPMSASRPHLVVVPTTVLVLQAVNDLTACSTYLKLHQVQTGFGAVVRKIALGDLRLGSQLLKREVSWPLVQQFFARFQQVVRADVFEPLLQAEDFVWQSVEHTLTEIEPTLHFWQDTARLAHLYGGQPVSCNLTDLMTSHANGLPYTARLVGQFRDELYQELSLRYMLHERLQQSILSPVHHQFAVESVTL